MHKELVNKAIELFEEASPEKWFAFSELSNTKEEIKRRWMQKFHTGLKDRAEKDLEDLGWKFDPTVCNGQWFQTDYGKQSLSIQLAGNHSDFYLWINPDVFPESRSQIAGELENPKYSIIKSTFEELGRFREPSTCPAHLSKVGSNLFLGDIYISNLDGDQFAWFAGNKTEDCVKQIADQVCNFLTTPTISDLITELNKLTEEEANKS